MGVATLVAAVVPAVLTFISNKDANEQNRKAVEDTNATNIDIANINNAEEWKRVQAQNEFNVQQDKEANAYNSFGAQMNRARNAGVNPASILGNVAASSVTSASPHPMQAPNLQSYQKQPFDFASTTNGSLQMALQSINQYRQAKFQNNDELRKEEQHDIDMKLKNLDYARQMEDNPVETGQKKEALRAIKEENDRNERKREELDKRVDKENEFLDKQISDKQKDVEVKQEQINASQANTRLQDWIAKQNAKEQRRLNSAQINHLNELAETVKNERNIRNDPKSIDNILKKWQSDLTKANLDGKQNEEAFLQILRESEKLHTDLKDASLLNKFVERAFGLGFRDIGNALSSFAKAIK